MSKKNKQPNTPDVMTEQDKGRWAPAPGYASWRAIAEVKLAKMERRHADLRCELNLLDDDIYELLRIAGNGAVGGTAWKLHNDKVSSGDEPR
jgi:hypothetical protein